jgi:hypothetical protein
MLEQTKNKNEIKETLKFGGISRTAELMIHIAHIVII